MLTRHWNIAVSIGLFAGLLVTGLLADHHRESAPHRCVGCATGQCQAGTPHGYWKPSWRRWPGASSYGGFKQSPPAMKVPGNELPDKYDEIRLSPRTRADAARPTGPTIDSTGPTGPPSPGGGLLSPIVPPDDGSNVPSGDVTPADPFSPGPETVPNNVADPFSPGPSINVPAPDNTPAPTNDFFENLGPLPDAPAEPDDNLFDEYGRGVLPGETESVPRSIKTRPIGQLDKAHPTPASPLPHNGNQLADLVTPTIQVDFQQGMVSPTRNPPLLLETPIQPAPLLPATKPQAAPKDSTPPSVSQVSHVQETQTPHRTAAESQTDNPLRHATASVAGKSIQKATSSATPKAESTAQRRLLRSRNPFR